MAGSTLDQRREELYAAAVNFVAQEKSQPAQRALCEAASAYQYARAEQFRTQHAAPPGEDGPVFPGYGRSAGKPIAGASKQDLEFYKRGAEKTLADPGKARYHDKERKLLAAIDAELAR